MQIIAEVFKDFLGYLRTRREWNRQRDSHYLFLLQYIRKVMSEKKDVGDKMKFDGAEIDLTEPADEVTDRIDKHLHVVSVLTCEIDETKPLVKSVGRGSAEILCSGPHLSTRIWVRAMIGLLKGPLFNLAINLMGNTKRTSGISLTPLGAQNKSFLDIRNQSLGWFSNRTRTLVDDGARKLNDWLDQMAERQIGHRKSCLVLSARFPVVNWRSRPVAKSAYYLSPGMGWGGGIWG